jgi:hypothetical protein
VSDPPEQPFSPTNTSSPITNSDDLGPRVGLDVFILLTTAPFYGLGDRRGRIFYLGFWFVQ